MPYCYNCFQEHNAPGPCPRCGYDPAQDVGKYPQAMPHGAILAGQFITGRALGQGGFGITYLALDNRSGGRVALKEFLPDTMAGRAAGSLTVTAYSGDRGQQFQYGLDCFLDEAKTLAKFIGNPNIVGVRSYFQENGTAYFTMDYIEGVSLKALLRERGGRIGWEEAVRLLLPVMDALEAVHREGLIHRDVTPDNIYITSDGQVKLLDFGAARYSLGDRSRSLDVVLKPGYAPKEQYVRRGRQGPYTDVYSLGACFYAAITGYLPPEALERWDKDEIVLPSARGVKLPPALEDVLLRALEVDAGDRYQTMTEFREALLASLPVEESTPVPEPVPVPPEPEPVPVPEPRVQPEPVPIPQPKRTYPHNDRSEPPALVYAGPPVAVQEPKPVPPPEKKPDTPDAKKKWYPLLGAAAAAAVLLAVIGIAMGGKAPASPAVSDLPDQTEDARPQTEPVKPPEPQDEPDESEDVLPVISPDTLEPEQEPEKLTRSDTQYPSDGTDVPDLPDQTEDAPPQTEPVKPPEPQEEPDKAEDVLPVISLDAPEPEQEPEKLARPDPQYPSDGTEFVYKDFIVRWVEGEDYAEYQITGYIGSGGAVTLPLQIGDQKTCSTGWDNLANSGITSLKVEGDGEVSQGFYDDGCLTSVEFASYTSGELGDVGGFLSCSALTDVIIGSNRRIVLGGFRSCTSLASVTIGSNCIIGSRSLLPHSGFTVSSGFSSCKSLTSVTIGSNCIIHRYSFEGCSSLTSVTIGPGCQIEPLAFNVCTSLTSLMVGSGCEIDELAFDDCTNLNCVTLSDDCIYYADSFPDTCVVTGGILME